MNRAFVYLLFAMMGAVAQAWQPQQSLLMTRWAAGVGPDHALPEYPRPQMVRTDWMSLNGLWNFGMTPDTVTAPPRLKQKILVPFPVESALSGVMKHCDEHTKLWYRRTFVVPAAWRGRRVKLNFGAADWSTAVWVNGRRIGAHDGGYDRFAFDITEALRWQGEEEITVCVTDPTEGDQPRGKQSRKPEGIFYTSTSGIWQTVWLEPVPQVHIDRLKMVPDLEDKTLRVSVSVNSFMDDLQVEAEAFDNGKLVTHKTGPANTELTLPIPNPHLWSPNDPFLYDLKVTLKQAGKTTDAVSSYFAMRSISLQQDSQGLTRIALNNKFVFGLGTLDQGFWPDGIYTAPSDDALRSDVDFLKRAGFNLVRKHVKVEPDRWYYWCDKLGLMVWQDMPSANNETPGGRREFKSELLQMVSDLENHPSIVVWVLFNEGWGEHDTALLTQWLKAMDPSRLVDDASGWTDMRAGDLIDMHNYPGPDCPTPEAHRAAVLGEFGGLGLVVPAHAWPSNSWGYVMLTNRDELANRYTRMLSQLWKLHTLRGLSAAIYTQTTDVETECNGLLTYDRAVEKIDPQILRVANRGGFWGTPMKTVLANALFGRTSWKYTTEPPASDWYESNFDASSWKSGLGSFGSVGTPAIEVNTTWTNSDIWLRRDFELRPEEMPGLKIHMFHDEDAEVYLNGVPATSQKGFLTDYDVFDISKAALGALHPGKNSIAVHCHQTTGGQGIDVGLLTTSADSEKK